LSSHPKASFIKYSQDGEEAKIHNSFYYEEISIVLKTDTGKDQEKCGFYIKSIICLSFSIL
jgi:hypothetical protein